MISRAFIEAYFSDMKRAIDAISAEEIDKAVDVLFNAWKSGSQVFTCGNGGSASAATHLACDLLKNTTVEGKRRLKAHCLNDNIPLMTALINDDGFENLFYEQLKSLFQPGDVLIAISVHGGAGADKAGPWSQNLLKATKYAQDMGGKAIALTGFDGGPMKEIADASIVVPVNSTLQVESFHSALGHLICGCLRQRISEAEEV